MTDVNQTPIVSAGDFQSRVAEWLVSTFGEHLATDRDERNCRFLEEAVELVQARGCGRSVAHQLVDYVFDRPAGEPAQEVGGVLISLAGLCQAGGLDMRQAGEAELARAFQNVEKIRRKQVFKPIFASISSVRRQAERFTHSTEQIFTWARDYEQLGGHALIVQMLRSYAGLLTDAEQPEQWSNPAPALELSLVKADEGVIACDSVSTNAHPSAMTSRQLGKPAMLLKTNHYSQEPNKQTIQLTPAEANEAAIHMLIVAGTVGIAAYYEDGTPTANKKVVLRIAKALHGDGFEETFADQLAYKPESKVNPVCIMCNGKGWHEVASAQLPGQPKADPVTTVCRQCAESRVVRSSPTVMATPGALEPELALPAVPQSVIDAITAYGDARADNGNSAAAIGKVIREIRSLLGQVPNSATDQQEIVVSLKLKRDRSVFFAEDLGVEIAPSEWADILGKTSKMEPIASGQGTHCCDETFLIDGCKVAIRYEHGSTQPIDIRRYDPKPDGETSPVPTY